MVSSRWITCHAILTIPQPFLVTACPCLCTNTRTSCLVPTGTIQHEQALLEFLTEYADPLKKHKVAPPSKDCGFEKSDLPWLSVREPRFLPVYTNTTDEYPMPHTSVSMHQSYSDPDPQPCAPFATIPMHAPCTFHPQPDTELLVQRDTCIQQLVLASKEPNQPSASFTTFILGVWEVSPPNFTNLDDGDIFEVKSTSNDSSLWQCAKLIPTPTGTPASYLVYRHIELVPLTSS